MQVATLRLDTDPVTFYNNIVNLYTVNNFNIGGATPPGPTPSPAGPDDNLAFAFLLLFPQLHDVRGVVFDVDIIQRLARGLAGTAIRQLGVYTKIITKQNEIVWATQVGVVASTSVPKLTNPWPALPGLYTGLYDFSDVKITKSVLIRKILRLSLNVNQNLNNLPSLNPGAQVGLTTIIPAWRVIIP